MHAIIEPCESVHASRKLGIGGSLAAAVTGLSRHKTKHAALADLLGLTPQAEPTRPMRIGTLSQDLIKAEYEIETGCKVIVPGDKVIYKHPKHPWMICHPDGLINGQPKGAEFKVAGQHSWHEWGEPEYTQVPQEYYVQSLHCMIVTGLRQWDLVVLIGTEIKIYPILWDEQQARDLFAAEKLFWTKHVINKEPLPADASDDCRMLMQWMYNDPSKDEEIPWADGEAATILNRLAMVKVNYEAEKANFEELKNKARALIGNLPGLRTDKIVAKWPADKNGDRSLRLTLVEELEGVAG